MTSIPTSLAAVVSRGAVAQFGRAPESHSGGHRFDPVQLHQLNQQLTPIRKGWRRCFWRFDSNSDSNRSLSRLVALPPRVSRDALLFNCAFINFGASAKPDGFKKISPERHRRNGALTTSIILSFRSARLVRRVEVTSCPQASQNIHRSSPSGFMR